MNVFFLINSAQTAGVELEVDAGSGIFFFIFFIIFSSKFFLSASFSANLPDSLFTLPPPSFSPPSIFSYFVFLRSSEADSGGDGGCSTSNTNPLPAFPPLPSLYLLDGGDDVAGVGEDEDDNIEYGLASILIIFLTGFFLLAAPPEVSS